MAASKLVKVGAQVCLLAFTKVVGCALVQELGDWCHLTLKCTGEMSSEVFGSGCNVRISLWLRRAGLWQLWRLSHVRLPVIFLKCPCSSLCIPAYINTNQLGKTDTSQEEGASISHINTIVPLLRRHKSGTVCRHLCACLCLHTQF